MTTLDDVKPDTIMVMTSDLDRLFKLEGCNPACHACHSAIALGEKFRLASTPDGRDVMLCDQCTMMDLVVAEVEETDRKRVWKDEHPGFSRLSR